MVTGVVKEIKVEYIFFRNIVAELDSSISKSLYCYESDIIQ